MNDEPKRIGLVWPLIIVLAFAATMIAAMVLIGDDSRARADRINDKLTILTVGVTVALVIVATSFPIRQWRRGEEKPETVREIIKDGTQRVREIHYGAPPKYDALGQPSAVSPFAYPAMVDAAYRAGVTGSQQTAYAAMPPREAWNWQEELPADATDGANDVPAPQGWNGEIAM